METIVTEGNIHPPPPAARDSIHIIIPNKRDIPRVPVREDRRYYVGTKKIKYRLEEQAVQEASISSAIKINKDSMRNTKIKEWLDRTVLVRGTMEFRSPKGRV